MLVDRVTITGADESIDPDILVEFSRKYPFVEWGILYSPNRQGKAPRYPSLDWIAKLHTTVAMALKQGVLVQLSAHLCGPAARMVFNADLDEFDKWILDYGHHYDRAQLNGYSDNMHSEYMRVVEKHPAQDFILQCKAAPTLTAALVAWRTSPNVHAIYDPSGGAGKRPDSWPEPPQGLYTGYAGGIGPDNVESVLQAISGLKNTVPTWIDMESRVRSDDDQHFLLPKVEQVLQIASRYVHE